MTDEQKRALLAFANALGTAMECGALDILQGHLDNADSINDISDALNDALPE